MWGWEGIQAAIHQAQIPDKEIKAKKEAMDKIEREGRGTCKYCGEEIIKNENMSSAGWTWESELMLGFCDKSSSKAKHEPMVKYNLEDGVYNIP